MSKAPRCAPKTLMRLKRSWVPPASTSKPTGAAITQKSPKAAASGKASLRRSPRPLAAKNASVSYVQEVQPDTLGHALVSGSVPKGYAAHLTHLLDEAPVPLVVMAVEEAAANEGVAPKAVWRNVAKLAKSLGVHRQGLWA